MFLSLINFYKFIIDDEKMDIIRLRQLNKKNRELILVNHRHRS